MSFRETIIALFDTFGTHISLPDNLTWVPVAASLGIGAVGIVMLVRGARLAPGILASGLALAGGFAGYQLASQVAAPGWVGGTLGAVIATIAAFTMFRLWQATALAVCAAVVATSLIGPEVLPSIQDWLEPAPENGLVTLAPAGAVVRSNEESLTAGAVWSNFSTQVASLWNHLSAKVPEFKFNFLGVSGTAATMALAFGFFFPRLARASWTSLIGTVALGVGVTAGLQQVQPQALDWLTTNNQWAWGIVAAVWLSSLIYNYRSIRPKASLTDDTSDAPESDAKPALA